MKFKQHNRNSKAIVELVSTEYTIESASDFLDVMSNAGSRTILIHSGHLHEDFYDLKTGLAGEILQKVSNYGIRLGIIGDHSQFASGAMHDFILESDRTRQVLFTTSVAEAIDRFSV